MSSRGSRRPRSRWGRPGAWAGSAARAPPAARSPVRAASSRRCDGVHETYADDSFREDSRQDADADGRVQVEHAPPVPDQRVAVEANDLVVIPPGLEVFDGADLT